MAQIVVAYRALDTVLGVDYHHKDILFIRDDGSILVLGAFPDRNTDDSWFDPVDGDTGKARSINSKVFLVSSSAAEDVLSDYIGAEVIANGTNEQLHWRFILAINEMRSISDSDTGYHPTITNSNWAADRAIFEAGWSLPSLDGASLYWSPGSIDEDNIAPYFDPAYGPREGDEIDISNFGIASPNLMELLQGIAGNDADNCFPAGTLIAMWPADATPRADGTYDQTAILAGLWQKPIEDITPADIVVAHDVNGNLVPGRVTQLLHNTTDEWLHLSNGTYVTPGHRYLRPDGSFAEIQDIIADDGRIAAADGAIQTVTAEVIRYSAETAHMFEEAEMLVYGTSGGVALAA